MRNCYFLLKKHPVGFKTKPETCRKARLFGGYRQYVTDRSEAVEYTELTSGYRPPLGVDQMGTMT